MEDRLIEALDRVTWYNGLAPIILKWIEYGDDHLKQNTDKYSRNISCPMNYLDETGESDIQSQLQVIWMILVSMFGDYGTSPRYGWIEAEHWEECKEFINNICEIELEDKERTEEEE